MKTLIALVLGALILAVHPAQAQSRAYSQPELDALLAPVALYPDALLSQVLMAATYPADVGEAAAFARANPHLKGEDAVRAADPYPWDPSVKSLLAFPDVLQRMDESPQWMTDLGQAFLVQEPQVMDTVQDLRRRAHAAGHLQSNEHYAVQQHGPSIVIVPARPHVVYVPYYSPYVVYGPWWWPHYRPVYWRPWRPAPVTLSATFFFGNFDWHRRHVRVVQRPVYVHPTHTHVTPGRWRHDDNRRNRPRAAVTSQPFQRVPEAQRQPIVRSLPPAKHVETPRRQEQPRAIQQQPRTQERREWRSERRQEQRKEHRQKQREARHNRDRRG